MNKLVVGLWKHTSKNGRTYLNGSIGIFGWRLAIFKNERKTGPNQPDYNLVIERKKLSEPKPIEVFDEGDVPF
jgi:hypothetical protein